MHKFSLHPSLQNSSFGGIKIETDTSDNPVKSMLGKLMYTKKSTTWPQHHLPGNCAEWHQTLKTQKDMAGKGTLRSIDFVVRYWATIEGKGIPSTITVEAFCKTDHPHIKQALLRHTFSSNFQCTHLGRCSTGPLEFKKKNKELLKNQQIPRFYSGILPSPSNRPKNYSWTDQNEWDTLQTYINSLYA